MRHKLFTLAALLSSLILFSCDLFGDDEGRSSGQKIPATVRLISNHLKSVAASKPMVSGRIVVEPEGDQPNAGEGDSLHPDSGTWEPPGEYLSYWYTPTNADGRLLQLMLMVGEPGEGKGGSALFLIGPDNGFGEPSVTNVEAQTEYFNLKQKVSIAGGFNCCWETYPKDEQAYTGWIEILLAYIDMSFFIEAGVLQGEHTVRMVYADVPEMGLRKGDLLYRETDAFKWFDSNTDALTSVRPDSALQIDHIASYAGTSGGRGNQMIASMQIGIPDSLKAHMPAQKVMTHSWNFDVDFDMTGGIIFRREDPEQMQSLGELLKAFDIFNTQDNVGSGISAQVVTQATPLAGDATATMQ